MNAFRKTSALGLAAAGTLLLAPLVALDAQAAPPPTCFGQPVTIMGTPGDDTLVGEAGVADVIYGGPGNDYISGGDFYDDGEANDLLCGGAGDDRVSGSPGNDKLRGGWGNDRLDGGNGADLELGDAGADRIGRGSFADADDADDVMRGGSGNDVLVGGWGADQMYGDRGADRLVDSECDGPTLMVGGPGRDYLESWTSSFEGSEGPCNVVSDDVRGSRGVDIAKVDAPDTVRSVERLTRIR